MHRPCLRSAVKEATSWHKTQRAWRSSLVTQKTSHRPDADLLTATTVPTSKPELNVYTTSIAPDSAQLKYAHRFFTAQPPALLFSNAQFRLLPNSHHPEVTFLGRSNVGKSSMLNALFNRREVAYTSSKPGKTRLMNAFGVSPQKLSAAPQSGTKGEIMAESWRRMRGGVLVVDQPGYGSGSRAEWGKEIMKYLQQRKQLRRAFILIDSEHGLKDSDLTILQHLFQHGVPHTVVLSKVDKIIHPHSKMPSPEGLLSKVGRLQLRINEIQAKMKKDVWAGRDAATDILCVSSEKSLDGFGTRRGKIGIDELRWAVLCACGLQEQSTKPTFNLGDINILD